MHTSWRVVDWNRSTPEQMSRALNMVNRLGVQGRLLVAVQGGREGEQRRLELERRLTNALDALPLERLENPAPLLEPGMPSQAVSMLAFRRAMHAEERAQQVEATCRQLQQ